MITHSETITFLKSEISKLVLELQTAVSHDNIEEVVELVEQLSLIAVAWQTVAHILTNPNPND